MIVQPVSRGLLNSPSCGVALFFAAVSRAFKYSCSARMHTKARCPIYPGSDVKRFPVEDAQVDWAVDFPEYKPVEYSEPKILTHKPSWADPDISKVTPDLPLLFNQLDGNYNVNRVSFMGLYKIVEGIPRNPMGRTGITGRGLLGKWGPNHAADPIVTRWKRDGKHQKILVKGKPVLEFVAIKRKDEGSWAFPGGMVDPGEEISRTLKREFGEEALNALDMSDKEKDSLQHQLDEVFEHGHTIYKGYIDDPRNTDNSWMESVAVNFHDELGSALDVFRLQAGDDAGDVSWTTASDDITLYASHKSLLQQVVKLHFAHW